MTAYTEYRCKNCAKLLFKGLLIDSEIEIKCKKCHELTTIKSSSKNEYLCLIKPCPNRIPMT